MRVVMAGAGVAGLPAAYRVARSGGAEGALRSGARAADDILAAYAGS